MEVLCFGLSLPLSEHDTIKDCVNIYCEWLSALLPSPKVCVPQPIRDDPHLYAQIIIAHLHYLFVPRKEEGKFHVVLDYMYSTVPQLLQFSLLIKCVTENFWFVLYIVVMKAHEF